MRLSDEERAARRAERERVQAEEHAAEIRALVDEAPPLTDEQRALIAALLRRDSA